MKRIFYCLAMILLVVGCADDDSFSTSSALRLGFSADTLKMDTVFSRTASSTYTFWVHNRNSEGIRLNSVYLSRKNQTGFRANVDGTYLDNTLGSQVNELEIRAKDSILVFVELTAAEAGQLEPKLIEDDLVFRLENGHEQHVNLRAWTWDAEKWTDPTITTDSLIVAERPVVVYGTLTIAEGARLRLKHTTLYLHDQAGIDVYGTLETEGCTLRGDRLDRMFDYLPYDRVSGQWRGVRFAETSTDNILKDTEIRNASQAVICDSAAIDSLRPRLTMERCIVHNADGDGVQSINTYIILRECQLSNTMGNCLSISGGIAEISRCTLAQFYPFSGYRGEALYFANHWSGNAVPLLRLDCEDTIVTGYEDDEVMGHPGDDEGVAFNYRFVRTLLRTPKVETEDSVRFADIIWETPKDSIQGKKHFRLIDEENFIYDFHLDSLSTAQGKGCY